MKNYNEEYRRWLAFEALTEEERADLVSISEDEEKSLNSLMGE